MILKLLIIASLILAGAQAGQMITPNTPVGFSFEYQVIHENGTRTVYISDYMLPNPEPGITFVQVNEGCGC